MQRHTPSVGRCGPVHSPSGRCLGWRWEGNYITNQHTLTLTRAKATLGKGGVGIGKQHHLAALPMGRWPTG